MTDMTREQRTAALREGGRRMGLIDLDLVLLAQDSVPIGPALQDLKARYPAKFFDARTASKEEVRSRWQELQHSSNWAARKNTEIADAVSQSGDVRTMSDADYKALCKRIGIR